MAEPPIPFPFEVDKEYPAARDLKIVISRPEPSTAEWDTKEPFVDSIRRGTLMRFVGPVKGGLQFLPKMIDPGPHSPGLDPYVVTVHANHVDARTEYSRRHHAEHEKDWVAKMKALGHWERWA